MPKLKTDKLLVSCYARHGDMCGLAPHCRSLGCASGHDSDDYVLVARFAYLQEAIDYCQSGAKRGVNMRFVSRICSPAYTSDYTPSVPCASCGYPTVPNGYRASSVVTCGDCRKAMLHDAENKGQSPDFTPLVG